jgi:hypothetical protein
MGSGAGGSSGKHDVAIDLPLTPGGDLSTGEYCYWKISPEPLAD